MPARDRQTGQYKHQWDYVGVVADGEVGRCDLPSCGKYRISNATGDKIMTPAQFQRAYPEEAKEF